MLCCTLEYSDLIVEGTTHLICLVGYREANKKQVELHVDNIMFEQGLCNNRVYSIVTGNDIGIPRGNITNQARVDRVNDLILRDKRNRSLMDHEMVRPRKSDWNTYNHMYA